MWTMSVTSVRISIGAVVAIAFDISCVDAMMASCVEKEEEELLIELLMVDSMVDVVRNLVDVVVRGIIERNKNCLVVDTSDNVCVVLIADGMVVIGNLVVLLKSNPLSM